jgi:crotonobetainyl-CoA:carnitine CoA-transferase CaiB-like acyl-CoA transferase
MTNLRAVVRDGATVPQAGPGEALRQVLGAVGWDRIPADHLAISGDDPILPSNFRIGAAGVATIGATGLAAADLWELRCGRRQGVAIDTRNAAMAMRSQRYVHIVNKPVSPAWDPLSGYYRTRDDRWVQLHCNFPHHRAGAIRVLGCTDDRESAAAAVAKWDAQDLEDTFVAEGLCAVMARDNAEWERLPHARAIDNLPVLEVIRIGDSAPEPLGPGDRPLSGIRALDLTRVLAGPTCGRTLAEHGADVMRISGPHLPYHANSVLDTGHGKLTAFLDLRDAEDMATLKGLVRDADIFTQAYRPGTLASRGLSPEELTAERPGIIYVSLCAYGHEGPWAARRGYDTLVQTATGIAVEEGNGGPPKHTPVSLLDYATGYLAAFGAMTALSRRAREGGSYLVRLSLCQTAHWFKNLGRLPDALDARNLPDPALDDVADLMTEAVGPLGRVRYLAPAIEMAETPARWVRPVSPIGCHSPVWPD